MYMQQHGHRPFKSKCVKNNHTIEMCTYRESDVPMIEEGLRRGVENFRRHAEQEADAVLHQVAGNEENDTNDPEINPEDVPLESSANTFEPTNHTNEPPAAGRQRKRHQRRGAVARGRNRSSQTTMLFSSTNLIRTGDVLPRGSIEHFFARQ